jgi:hypothetical protein
MASYMLVPGRFFYFERLWKSSMVAIALCWNTGPVLAK